MLFPKKKRKKIFAISNKLLKLYISTIFQINIFLVGLFFLVKSSEIILTQTIWYFYEGSLNLCQHCGDGLVKGVKVCCTQPKSYSRGDTIPVTFADTVPSKESAYSIIQAINQIQNFRCPGWQKPCLGPKWSPIVNLSLLTWLPQEFYFFEC